MTELEKLIAKLEGAIYQASIEHAWVTKTKLAAIKEELKKLATENN